MREREEVGGGGRVGAGGESGGGGGKWQVGVKIGQ